MDFAKVNVDIRTRYGKGNSRRARVAGKVPAILYGHKETPVSLVVDPLVLVKSLDKERKRNTVFTLTIKGDGAASGQQVTAMIRDVQVHPISRKVVHVDFIRVSMDEEVKVTVPLVLKGHPVGVVNGGNLHQSMHQLPVAAKPDAIPAKLELDVSALNIGDALHASDLKLPPGLRVLLEAKETMASVVAPRAEKTEETAAAAVPGAEGAAATPAEGAAAGAAAPAAGDKAAAAPAAGKDEKKGGDKKSK